MPELNRPALATDEIWNLILSLLSSEPKDRPLMSDVITFLTPPELADQFSSKLTK